MGRGRVRKNVIEDRNWLDSGMRPCGGLDVLSHGVLNRRQTGDDDDDESHEM
jgi:hypothetical protein